jgi:hypothetical protein
MLPLAMCGTAAAQDAPSVDDLVAKNVAARGGADKLKAIQDEKVSGTMTAPNGMQLPLTILEYIGKEDVENSPAYKLKLTTKQGLSMDIYLDAKTYLECRNTAKVNDMVVDTYPSDYKPEGGVLVPHTVSSKANGTPMMKMSMDKVEVNVPMDDSLFRLPKPETKKQ